MNPHVKSVRALDDYELEVSFENGECRRFDVKPYLGRGIFVRLRDRSLLRRFGWLLVPSSGRAGSI